MSQVRRQRVSEPAALNKTPGSARRVSLHRLRYAFTLCVDDGPYIAVPSSTFAYNAMFGHARRPFANCLRAITRTARLSC